jgi:hypothetical protein
MKEYLVTVQIDADTLRKAKSSKVLKSANELSEIIHEALAILFNVFVVP